jgi:hypothetical protein
VLPEVSPQKRWLSPLQFEIVKRKEEEIMERREKKSLVFRQQKGRSFDRSVFFLVGTQALARVPSI